MQKVLCYILLITSGLCLLFIGASSGLVLGAGTVHAQNEQPARPTLTPRPENPPPTTQPPAEPTTEPTARREDEDDDKKDRKDKPTAVIPGRITGTVIDQTTGAPAAGVAVRVGEVLLTTDANGNYDLPGLAPGTYTVALVVDPSQGHASQEPISVSLAAGATVVQHLAFRSLASSTPTSESATTVTPTATVESVFITLPTATPAPMPATLPTTGTAAIVWLLLPLGLVLGGLGGLVRLLVRRS